MDEWNFTASKMFNNASQFVEAYHTVLQPLCRELGLSPMAVDILMYIANNPENNTAKDICRFRGLKSGIVSVHVDRLVNEGLLLRLGASGDRRVMRLACTESAAEVVERGRALQKSFAAALLVGLSGKDLEVFRHCLTVLGGNIQKIRKNGIPEEDEKKQC